MIKIERHTAETDSSGTFQGINPDKNGDLVYFDDVVVFLKQLQDTLDKEISRHEVSFRDADGGWFEGYTEDVRKAIKNELKKQITTITKKG